MPSPSEILARAWTLISGAISGLSEHRGTISAAAMSYYALLSLFPAAIVLAAIAGLVFSDPNAHREVVDYLLENLPLSADERTRADVESMVGGVTSSAGTIGVIGLVGLTITASGLISATRNAVDAVFGGSVTRGALRGKALDVLLVIGLGLLMLVSMAGSLILAAISEDADGVLGSIFGVFTGWTGVLVPIAITVVVVAIAYVVLPVERQRLRDVWPAVAFTAVAFELLKLGFEFYLGHFADYSQVYGSLGAVIAFMAFVYLASLVFLIGAEIASLWPRLRDGELDSDDQGEGEGKSFGEEVRGFLRSLVARNPSD